MTQTRKLFLTLVISVVVLDGAMIGLYYALHIRDRLEKTQQEYVAVWVVLTLAVVLPTMKKIRALRRPTARR